QDDQAARDLVQLHHARGVDAQRVVDARHGRAQGTRAGGDDGGLEVDVLATLDAQGVGPGEGPAAADHGHAVGLEEAGEALDHAVHDGAPVGLHLAEVQAEPLAVDAAGGEAVLRLVPAV